jgi:hypothetical protein
VPLASHVLDLLVLPGDTSTDLEIEALSALFAAWQARGLLVPGRAPLRFGPGPGADTLVPGGFSSLWLDRPGGPTLFANQQGGFQVPCPSCGGPLAGPFGKAIQALRRGQELPVTCPACAGSFPLEGLALRPPGYLARGAVVFGDAGSDALEAGAQAELARVLGGVRLVARRRS